jgi:hypothetical protein
MYAMSEVVWIWQGISGSSGRRHGFGSPGDRGVHHPRAHGPMQSILREDGPGRGNQPSYPALQDESVLIPVMASKFECSIKHGHPLPGLIFSAIPGGLRLEPGHSFG